QSPQDRQDSVGEQEGPVQEHQDRQREPRPDERTDPERDRADAAQHDGPPVLRECLEHRRLPSGREPSPRALPNRPGGSARSRDAPSSIRARGSGQQWDLSPMPDKSAARVRGTLVHYAWWAEGLEMGGALWKSPLFPAFTPG